MENFFALIIGVGADLPATAIDAEAIHALLADPQIGAYPPENIEFLVNEYSSKENVLAAMQRIITKTAILQEATVLIYFSGHGLRIPRENDPNEFDYYLKTAGADKNRREETMLNGLVFSEKINAIKADKILVLLDCCHADGLKNKEISVFEELIVEEKQSNRALMEQLQSGEGRVFISSCDDEEESVILPGSANSLFTEVCLEVLHGRLSPADEFVSVVDLIYFIIKEVPKRVLPFRHKQRPIITEVKNLSPDYYICRNGSYQPSDKSLEYFADDFTSERLGFIDQYDNKI